MMSAGPTSRLLWTVIRSAGLGETTLMPRREQSADVTYHGLREAPDTAAITSSALQVFAAGYPDLKLQPLVVVIAAYNEADNIGAVLDEVPQQIADVPVSLLVIDDGSTDATTKVAERHGALVCTLSANRGHGVALRLGYRIARDGGVKFFAKVISALTRTHITDTSSGLRLMRADLTGTVTQTQPQYQTSELLIGALLQGYRVAEVPTVMRQRMSGASKKGRNLAYGLRYARVITQTYLRERRVAPGASKSGSKDRAPSTR